MNEHSLFYYSNSSFTNRQLPILNSTALYFDKLFILNSDKASRNIVGSGDLASNVAMLENTGILKRIVPKVCRENGSHYLLQL